MHCDSRWARRQFCAALSVALILLCLGTSEAAGQTATLSVTLDAAYIDRGRPVTGKVTINPKGSGTIDLTVELQDDTGRVADRSLARVILSGTTSAHFSLSSRHITTMIGKVQAGGWFVGGNTIDPASAIQNIVPVPIDYDDYWCNVWGGGDTSNAAYFDAIRQANVNLGHIFRKNSYSGYLFNLRPNNDFLEDKVWFEMTATTPLPEDQLAQYKMHLAAGNHGTPAARAHLIRPTSLNSASSLDALENKIRPRMQASRVWRPLQWNVSDEYGIYRRAAPFDYDLGNDAIHQFVAWLQTRYATIADLNAIWNTSFGSFNDLLDPVNAPTGGEAALIVTQEIRDREFPLNSGAGLTSARNFGPWSDFRTFMDITFAEAMKRCVEVGRSVDPDIRVGFEGAQAATPLSGYDYSRQLREVGSIEAYDQANSPEYIRSMRYDRYGNRIFSFITLFNQGTQQNVYTLWYRLLHYGVTGAPIWEYQDSTQPANSFFTDLTSYGLTSYATGVSPTFGEFENGLVKLLNQGEWDDSEVALLYSQKAIQISWMLDSEVDGKTWINRGNSWEPSHNSIFFAHVGWCKALEDIGIKGRFISYQEVSDGELAGRGVKALILPRVMALSDAEKGAIENWVSKGGVLIVDNMCGYYDEYLRRPSISDGGGWWDRFLGVARVDYSTSERNGSSSNAWTGTPVFQPVLAGFENLMTGLTSDGLYPVEGGLRQGEGEPLILWDNDPKKPSLLVKRFGDGKIVYLNLSLYRYGFSGASITSERLNPGSASAKNTRQLVKNLVALGGVTPKVMVKQGSNNPDGTDAYNLEKNLRFDGDIQYLSCVVNSYFAGTNDNWGARADTPEVCFGQAGATQADVTLVLANAANVYDVRKGQYLGYGASVNAQIPVYQGAVFALLPYKVNRLSIDSVQFDWLNRTTVKVSVVPDSGQAGNHVLRLEVFDPGGQPMPQLNCKVVARKGAWTGVIPFAANDTLAGSRLRFTDVATGVRIERVLAKLPGDINGDGVVDFADLLLLLDAWGAQWGEPNYNPAADLNGDHSIDIVDLRILVEYWGKPA